jgi:predicted metalloprotease
MRMCESSLMALWDKIKSRGNIQDRRSFSPTLALGGGGGLVGIALIVLLNYLNGGNIGDVLQQLPAQVPSSNISSENFEGQDSYEVFASTVLGSTTDYWTTEFAKNNLHYTPPEFVLFRQATQGACGISSSEVGPHYCPIDRTIYLDETFFDELQARFNAQGGDVAEAYVIAHEVGHHAQNLLGIMDDVNNSATPANTNDLSIKQELQADCFAGLWAGSIRDIGVFEPGEINEAIDAASAIGDDRIQQTIEGRITPENWTHGSSEQRVQWFNTGFESNSISTCNTF